VAGACGTVTDIAIKPQCEAHEDLQALKLPVVPCQICQTTPLAFQNCGLPLATQNTMTFSAATCFSGHEEVFCDSSCSDIVACSHPKTPLPLSAATRFWLMKKCWVIPQDRFNHASSRTT
jgi:hypothetical protein